MWPSMSTSRTAVKVYNAVPTPTRIKMMVRTFPPVVPDAFALGADRRDGVDGLVDRVEKAEAERQEPDGSRDDDQRQERQADSDSAERVSHRCTSCRSGATVVRAERLRGSMRAYQNGDQALVRSSLLSHWSRISSPFAM